jgi:CRISPR/Cas system-associated protein Cas10 (large subunit of type III CRISPR-Cas system)
MQSNNVAAVNWFTKHRDEIIYPEQCDKELDRIIEQITGKFQENNLKNVAEGVYKVLKDSDFFNNLCSDSRLPVCSLFHHLKNTAGIAVCLTLQQLTPDFKKKCLEEYEIPAEKYSDIDFISLIRLASLLHDIGKPRSYTGNKSYTEFHVHTTQTREIISSILEGARVELVSTYQLDKILPELTSKHHSREAHTTLEKLINNADSLASAADRTYEITAELEGSVLTVESSDRIFPHEIHFDGGDLQCLDSPHAEIIGYKSKISKRVKKKRDVVTLRLFYDSVVQGELVKYTGGEKPAEGRIALLSLDIMQIQEYIAETDKLPMLRGASLTVEEVLESACQVISQNVCEEAVLFKGGGNLLCFAPAHEEMCHEIKNLIERKVREFSKGGLRTAVVTKDYDLADLKNFSSIVEDLYREIEREKNRAQTHSILRTSDICQYCFKRKAGRFNDERICEVCAEKKHRGRERGKARMQEIIKKYNLLPPENLEHIGSTIAVMVVDGNMMGRIFTQTRTPAEYSYKSDTFDRKFRETVRKTIEDFIGDPELRTLITYNDHIGLDCLYLGGDDALIIINARGAFQFCHRLIKNVSSEFNFSKKFFNGEEFTNPTVTVSCGIAIADNRFPIYFLLDAARKMESAAKKAFREKTWTDELNLIRLPSGSLAFTAVSTAMPSDEHEVFTLPEDEQRLNALHSLILKSLKEEHRSNIANLITCRDSAEEQLNLIKYLYASGYRKQTQPLQWLDECEEMVRILRDEKLFKSAKMLIPQIWHFSGDENP